MNVFMQAALEFIIRATATLLVGPALKQRKHDTVKTCIRAAPSWLVLVSALTMFIQCVFVTPGRGKGTKLTPAMSRNEVG